MEVQIERDEIEKDRRVIKNIPLNYINILQMI
jgi:hypothetical protein